MYPPVLDTCILLCNFDTLITFVCNQHNDSAVYSFQSVRLTIPLFTPYTYVWKTYRLCSGTQRDERLADGSKNAVSQVATIMLYPLSCNRPLQLWKGAWCMVGGWDVLAALSIPCHPHNIDDRHTCGTLLIPPSNVACWHLHTPFRWFVAEHR